MSSLIRPRYVTERSDGQTEDIDSSADVGNGFIIGKQLSHEANDAERNGLP